MSSVLSGLRECWPVVGYRILDSRYFGVAQRRRRVFFVCGPTEAGVRSVLFEPEGGEGNPAEGDEAGQGVAASLTSGVGAASNDPGRRREDDVNLIVQQAISSKWAKGSSGPAGDEHHNLVTAQCHGSNVGPMGELRQGNGGLTGGVPFVAHALSSEGADASEDGTGRGTPMVVATLNSGGNDGGFRTEPGEHLVAYGWNKSAAQTMSVGEECPPLNASPTSNPAVGVRRLTPLECERLQGFPDGWTCLCLDNEAYQFDPDRAASVCKCPDSPRYRALGNAVTVNVIEWIGVRMP